MKKSVIISAFLALTFMADAARAKDVTYASDIKPVFETSCFGCHGEKKAKGKLRLDSLAGVLKGSEDGKVVIAGDSTKSPLVRAITGVGKKQMPPKARPDKDPHYKPVPLTPAQIALIKSWVEQGLK
jgi:mono/diheme cytochrome c family protein